MSIQALFADKEPLKIMKKLSMDSGEMASSMEKLADDIRMETCTKECGSTVTLKERANLLHSRTEATKVDSSNLKSTATASELLTQVLLTWDSGSMASVTAKVNGKVKMLRESKRLMKVSMITIKDRGTALSKKMVLYLSQGRGTGTMMN